MKPHLTVVANTAVADRIEEVRRATAAAKEGGLTLACDLAEKVDDLGRHADEIARLGDNVPVGIREEARQLVSGLVASAQRMRVILSRAQ